MSEVTIQQAMEIAIQHHRAGRLAEAESVYRQILEVEPDLPDALHNLGVIAGQCRHLDAGQGLILRAIALSPDQALFYSSLGTTLREMGKLEEAESAFRKSIALDPAAPETLRQLGQALFLANRLDDALRIYENATRQFPEDATFPYNQGVILSLKGELNQAADLYKRAIILKPRFIEAIMNLAVVLQRLGKIDESLDRYNQSLDLNPNCFETLVNRSELLKEIGLLNEAVNDLKRAIEIRPDYLTASDNLILLMHYLPEITQETINSQLSLWNERFAVPLRSHRTPHSRVLDPDKKLKIGFVSADFRSHPVGRFILPLLKIFDRNRLEIFCYSDGWMKDPTNLLCRQSVENWRELSGLSNAQAARGMREDGIDILMDLGNHTSGNRLRAFAEKPAPIQASWLAYCASTGLETMDYRFADPYLEPTCDNPGEPEKIYRLPRTYWCYPEPEESPRPAEAPSIKTGHVTFGCLNNFCKINHTVLEIWAEILRLLPESRIMLYVPEGRCRDRLFSDFKKLGVAENRVIPMGRSSLEEYFSGYGQMDVALDPFPFNGGTTTCDALWMGVPVVSLVGRRAVSRAGLSVLSNAGFGQWAAEGVDQYVKTAVELAMDEPLRAQLRTSMRKTMKSSPLMDLDRFSRDITDAFVTFWTTWISAGGRP